MGNKTKTVAAHSIEGATVRVYADISNEANAFLEALATSNGRTKKGQLEWMLNEAKKEHDVNEAETNKRASAAKKARK